VELPMMDSRRKPVRIVTYARARDDRALALQAAALRAFVGSRDGWQLVGEHADRTSAAAAERPGLQHALVDARGGKFDVLVVHSWDRLVRRLHDWERILRDLEAAGIVVQSASDPVDHDAVTGRLATRLLASMTERERRHRE
jgi:DNA invertase Pin-like site-specific DNA recombinase